MVLSARAARRWSGDLPGLERRGGSLEFLLRLKKRLDGISFQFEAQLHGRLSYQVKSSSTISVLVQGRQHIGQVYKVKDA
jgi:hypothetical protein